MEVNKIIQGDCIKEMKKLPDNSIDLILTEWAIHLFRNLEVFGSYKTKQGFFLDSNYQQDKFQHPSVKPEYMIRRIIRNLSNEGDIVLDCFAGSGTTAIACKQTNRKYIMIEINSKYVEIMKERLKQSTLFMGQGKLKASPKSHPQPQGKSQTIEKGH